MSNEKWGSIGPGVVCGTLVAAGVVGAGFFIGGPVLGAALLATTGVGYMFAKEGSAMLDETRRRNVSVVVDPESLPEHGLRNADRVAFSKSTIERNL